MLAGSPDISKHTNRNAITGYCKTMRIGCIVLFRESSNIKITDRNNLVWIKMTQ